MPATSPESAPMPPEPTDPLLTLLRDSLKNASVERGAQTAAFERALSGLRWELRVMLALVVLGALARDGVFAKVGFPGVTIETHAASAEPAGVPGVGAASAAPTTP